MEDQGKKRKLKNSKPKSLSDMHPEESEKEKTEKIKSEEKEPENKNLREEVIEKEEKPKAQKKPMDGIALLKEIGLKNVSNKTFINLQNLTHLLNKDFEKLHKTKALGFIQILERDFKVDLKELREDYLVYLNGGRRVSKKHTISKPSQKRNTIGKSKHTSPSSSQLESPKIKLGPIILLLLASGLLYYLYHVATYDEEQIEVGNITTENIQKSSQDQEDSLIADALVEDGNEKKSADENSSDEDLELNKIVHKMLNQESEQNNSALVTNQIQSTETENHNISEDTEKSEDNVADQEDEIVVPVVEKDMLEENSSKGESEKEIREVLPLPALSKIEDGTLDKKAVNSKKEKKVKSQNKKPNIQKIDKAIIPSLKIVPIEKAWVGVIFLDDLTKKDYLIRRTLKLDPNRDQIILVGHNKFKIYNHGKNASFHSKKMVRFLYQGGVLREIDKQEYLNLSEGVRW